MNEFFLTGSHVALITPFTKRNNIDVDSLQQLVQWHVKMKTDSIVCCGSTGEVSSLSVEEKMEVIKTCKEASNGKIKIIANTGCNDTKKSIEMTSKASDIDVDACLVIVPYYNLPTQQGCFKHFQKINEVGVKLIVYHHPGRTGITLHPFTFDKIASLENVVAIKDSSNNLIHLKHMLYNNDLPLLSGDDSLLIPIMKAGGCGIISVIANCLPAEIKKIVSLCKEKKEEAATEEFNKLERLLSALSRETNPQCIKYALSLMGMACPFMRLPLLEPSKNVKEGIEVAVRELGLI